MASAPEEEEEEIAVPDSVEMSAVRCRNSQPNNAVDY